MESLESLGSFEAWQLGWLGELGKLWLRLQLRLWSGEEGRQAGEVQIAQVWGSADGEV